MQRYQRFMIADALKDEPRYRSCLRINCPNGQTHEAGEAEPLMVCSMCGYKMCYVHAKPWHAGQTCRQYDKSRRQRTGDQASVGLISKLTKACPGANYNAPIEKYRGCDHMTCMFVGPLFS